MSSKLKQLHEAKNVKDVFALVSWDTLQKLAVLPFILFTLFPIIFIVQNMFQMYPIEMQIYSINSISWKLALGIYAFGFVKALTEKRLGKDFFKRNITLYFFAAFILLILISTYVNRNELFALTESRRGESYISFIIYAAVYFGCSMMINDRRIKAFSIRLLQIAALIQVAAVFIDRHIIRINAVYQSMWRGSNGTIISVFSNRNFYCYYLTIVILVSAALFVFGKNMKWRIFDLFCFGANVWTLLRADTLGCFLAVVIGLIFIGVLSVICHKRFNKAVFIPLCILAAEMFILTAFIDDTLFKSFLGLFVDVDMIVSGKGTAASGSYRWGLWTHTVKYISERPLLGFGNEGIFERLHDEVGNSRPHNEVLQYAAFFGIPAALMYVSGVFSVFLRGLKRRFKLDMFTLAAFAGAFGYLVSSMFGNTVFTVAPYFFCIVGLAYRPCREEKESAPMENQQNTAAQPE